MTTFVSTNGTNSKWIGGVITDVRARSVDTNGAWDGRAIKTTVIALVVINAASKWTASVESRIANADEGFSVVSVVGLASSVEEASSSSGSSWSADSIWIGISAASSTAVRVDTVDSSWVTSISWRTNKSASGTLIDISASEVGVLLVSSTAIACENSLVKRIN